jgi:hypothetical protein
VLLDLVKIVDFSSSFYYMEFKSNLGLQIYFKIAQNSRKEDRFLYDFVLAIPQTEEK